MNGRINKKDLGMALILIDICICILVYLYLSRTVPIDNNEILNILYFGRSKLFIIGLFLILLDKLEHNNK